MRVVDSGWGQGWLNKNRIHGFYKGMPGRKGICYIIFLKNTNRLELMFGKDANIKVYKCLSSPVIV